MTDDDAREYARQIEAMLRENGFGWALDEPEPDPPSEIDEDRSAWERRLLALTDILDALIVQRAKMEDAMTETFGARTISFAEESEAESVNLHRLPARRVSRSVASRTARVIGEIRKAVYER